MHDLSKFIENIFFDLNLKLVGAFNGTTWSGNIQKGFLMFNMQSLVGGIIKRSAVVVIHQKKSKSKLWFE